MACEGWTALSHYGPIFWDQRGLDAKIVTYCTSGCDSYSQHWPVSVVLQILSVGRAFESAGAAFSLSKFGQRRIGTISHLTYVMAQDPFVIETAQGDGTGVLNQRFEDFAAQAGLDAIYLMNEDGITISASNFREVGSFVGQNYAFRPYFQMALSGEQGRFYAIGTTTGLPGYFIANAVLGEAGTPTGVVAIKIDFSDLQESWRNSGEQVLLANEDGVVLLSSDPDWQYRVLNPLSEQQQEAIRQARQFPGQELEPLDWSRISETQARISGSKRLHLAASELPHGWSLHYFASDDRAVARSWLVTALFVLLAGVVFTALQIQRTRRVGAALARSEREEAQLRQANERLAIEVEDRKPPNGASSAHKMSWNAQVDWPHWGNFRLQLLMNWDNLLLPCATIWSRRKSGHQVQRR